MRSKWLAPLCILFMLVVTILVYNQLPAVFPVHWGIDGQVNGTAERTVGAFLIPVISTALWLLLLAVPSIDPRREAYKTFSGTYQTVINLLLVFMAVVQVMILGAALGFNIPVAQVIMVSVGLLIAFLGNLLGRVQPNWFVGIRTPWTLSDPEVWKQTHRLGGRTMFFAGLLATLSALLFPLAIATVIFFILIMAGVLIPVVYSYILWQRQQSTRGTSQL